MRVAAKVILLGAVLGISGMLPGCSGLTASGGAEAAYYYSDGQYYRYDRHTGDYVCVNPPPWWYHGPVYGEVPPHHGQAGDHDNGDGHGGNGGGKAGGASAGNHDDHAGSSAHDRLPGPPKNEAAGFSNPFAPHDSHGPSADPHNAGQSHASGGESHSGGDSHAGGGDAHSGGGGDAHAGSGDSHGAGDSHDSGDSHSSGDSGGDHSAPSHSDDSSGGGGGGKK